VSLLDFPTRFEPLSKFIEDSILNLFQKIYHEFCWQFEVKPTGKVDQNIQIKFHAKFGYFWNWESLCFEFQNSEEFEIYVEKYKMGRAHSSVTLHL
jgi:hypothetical protein